MATGFQLGNVGREGFGIGGMQLEQFELVAITQQALNDERGPRIHLVAACFVEAGHHVQVVLQNWCHRLGQWAGNQFEEAFCGLRAGLCVIAIQAVQTCAGMGVEHSEGRIFLR